MKKTAKKNPAKASGKKAMKNLGVKPAKGATVRGGEGTVHKGWIEISSPSWGVSQSTVPLPSKKPS